MFDWLRRLREAARRDAEAERRLMKPGQSQRPFDRDQIEELVRLVGDDPPRVRPRAVVRSARGNVSRR